MAALSTCCGERHKNPADAIEAVQILLILISEVLHPCSKVIADRPQTGPFDKEHLLPMLVRHGFEIVDKRSGKEVYLDGSWAELFQQHIEAWQVNAPTQEEVEDTLEQYAELAQNPVLVH